MRAPIAILAWLAALAGAAGFGAPPAALNARLDRLVAAYPDFLRSHDGQWLVLKDGRRFAISDGRADKSFDETIEHPDIDDMFATDYPAGAEATWRACRDHDRQRRGPPAGSRRRRARRAAGPLYEIPDPERRDLCLPQGGGLCRAIGAWLGHCRRHRQRRVGLLALVGQRMAQPRAG